MHMTNLAITNTVPVTVVTDGRYIAQRISRDVLEQLAALEWTEGQPVQVIHGPARVLTAAKYLHRTADGHAVKVKRTTVLVTWVLPADVEL